MKCTRVSHPRRSYIHTFALFAVFCMLLATPLSAQTLSNGTYRIVARHSGKVLEVANHGTANGSNVQQWTYDGGGNEHWIVTGLGGGQYQIVGVESNKCLDAYKSGTTNGTNVQVWTYGGASNQKWTITATDSGYYRISPVHAAAMALDVSSASTADGANVYIWTYASTANQQFAFQPIAAPTATATPSPTAAGTPSASPYPTAGLLSQNKPASASSFEDAATYPAAAAFDGKTTTRWSSAWSDPQWITVDLGATASLSQVLLRWEAAYAAAYQIQSSTDGTTWTTLQNVTNGHGGLEAWPVSGSGRYVRIYGTSRATQYGYSLWEVEVYGSLNTATPTPTGPTPTATQPPTPTVPPQAIMLIDQRLYANVSTLIDQYRSLAAARRGFEIGLRVVNGIDDWRYDQVRSYLVTERQNNPTLEGVLFIGNIKIPSFYKSRNDSNLTRLIPRYYEDLDGVFTKTLADNATDPRCIDPTDPNCYLYGPTVVGPHDFDYTNKGPNPDPEIWTSYIPVGFGSGTNTYSDFARQITPFLQKVIRFYSGGITTNGRYYFITNDRGPRFDLTWDAFSKYNIDVYGKPGPNGETGAACVTSSGNLCYQRWPMESYTDAQAFDTDYDRLWVGEGWQQDSVFLSHMNAQSYQVVEVNTHANEVWSLVSSDQARGITRGGLLVALYGCGVGGFRQPGSPSAVDTTVFPDGNLTVSYLYGSSNAVAALGDPFWRGHYAYYPIIYRDMKLYGEYLGRAHLTRMKQLYADSTSPWELRENGMEMLFGDPFMDFSH